MARRIKWTPSATVDLVAIADYIAKDSPRYAAGTVRKIRDAVRSLGRLPERGAIVPELQDEAIREISVGNYRIIYRVNDPIVVLGIVHAAVI